MKTYTVEEITAKVEEIWAKEENYPSEVKVRLRKDKIEITLSSMYSAPSLNLRVLMALADFFGTKNINDDDRFGYGGCETCDYGSEYGYTLTIRPEVN